MKTINVTQNAQIQKMNTEKKFLVPLIDKWQSLKATYDNSGYLIDPNEMCQAFDDYIEFVSKPISLGQFVPCDSSGKYMKHPDEIEDMVNDSMIGAIQAKNYDAEYKEALSRMLFVGFKVVEPSTSEIAVYKENGNVRISFIDKGHVYYHNTIIKTLNDITDLKLEMK